MFRNKVALWNKAPFCSCFVLKSDRLLGLRNVQVPGRFKDETEPPPVRGKEDGRRKLNIGSACLLNILVTLEGAASQT
jgi:hypothetical protein